MDIVRSKPHFRVPAFDESGNNQVCIFVCCILVEVISTSIISSHSSFYTTMWCAIECEHDERKFVIDVYVFQQVFRNHPKAKYRMLELNSLGCDSQTTGIK